MLWLRAPFWGTVGALGVLAATGGDARGSLGAASTCLSSQVHIANQCEVGGLRLAAAGDKEMQAPGALEAVAAMVAPLPAVPGPDTPAPAKPGGPGRLRDPNTCFFEGQQRPHGARWAPNYDPLCSLCTCQVGGPRGAHWGLGSGAPEPNLSLSLQRRTVICDPVVCPPPSCPSPVQAPDQCCPVCPGECPAGVERVLKGPPRRAVRPLGREGRGGPSSAFTLSLDPQRNKMSKTSPGCQGTGTLARVSWKCVNAGMGSPAELLGRTAGEWEGKCIYWDGGG